MHKKILVASGLICMCLLAIAPSASAAGVGVSPPALSYEKVLKGGTAQEQFTIFNSADADVYYDIRVEGNDWFSFEPNPPVKVPAKGNVKVNAIVNPPGDTANGVYNCTVYVEPSGVNVTAGEGAVMGILPAIGITTSIEITGEQILAGNVYKISVESNEIDKPIRFKIGFANTGTVRAEPETSINILKDTKVMETLKKSDEIIPGEAKEITVEWIGKDIGDYTGNVNVILDGKLLSEKDLKFKVLERGALTCKGEIVDIKAPKEISVGMPAKIEVGFKNTGSIALEAKIKGDVILNHELVEVIESEPVLIDVGKTGTLTAYLNPENPGDYLIDGDVVYEGKKAKISKITISAKSAEASGMNMNIIMFSGLALIATVILIFATKRRLKKI
jgi:archaellum component FlaF (FlaF/FlaG flagellin family)